MKVVLLHQTLAPDAAPDDLDLRVQIAAVRQALHAGGHEVETVVCGLDLAELRSGLLSQRPDVVFYLVEALDDSDRLSHLPAWVIEHLDIPLAGCPAGTMARLADKPAVKHLLRRAGLPTPPWIEASGAGWPEQGPARTTDWIVKSAWEHGSVGLDAASLYRAADIVAVGAALADRRKLGGEWFAEAFVEGREFNLALLDGPAGPRVLPPAEIVFENFPGDWPRIVDYRAKWETDSSVYRQTTRCFVFPPADRMLLARLEELALSCWRLLGLRGYARVDFRVDAHQQPWILEVNPNPCLSPDAGFAAALDQAGIAYQRAIETIVQAAFNPRVTHITGPTRAPSDKPAEPDLTWRSEVLPADVGAVRDLVAATGFFHASEIEVAVELVTERLSKGSDSGYEFLFACDSDRPVAYACWGPIPCTAASFDIYWIAVDPARQGRGIGRALLGRCETRIREHGGRQAYIETSHRAQYAATRAFYERCGYELVSLLSDFYAPGDAKATYVKTVS